MFILTVSVAAAAQAPSALGGAQPKWGLSPSELVDQSGGTIERLVAPPGDTTRIFGLQLGAKSDASDFNVVYLFTPMTQRLAAIEVSPHDMKKCLDWASELRASLGEPYHSGQEGASVVADWQDAQISAEYTITGHSTKHMLCRLVLRPSAGLPPERGR
jgi:hypothetical protein